MMVAIFGIVCGVAGFAIGWNFCRKETLIHLLEKGALDKDVFKAEIEKDF
jgi:hypothetical protein